MQAVAARPRWPASLRGFGSAAPGSWPLAIPLRARTWVDGAAPIREHLITTVAAVHQTPQSSETEEPQTGYGGGHAHTPRGVSARRRGCIGAVKGSGLWIRCLVAATSWVCSTTGSSAAAANTRLSVT